MAKKRLLMEAMVLYGFDSYWGENGFERYLETDRGTPISIFPLSDSTSIEF